MKKLLNFFIFIMINFIIIGCCSQRKVGVNNEYLGTSMKYSLYLEDASLHQLDSLIVADTLPALESWLGSTFVDYDSNETIVKRMYFKTTNKNKEILYIVTGVKEPFDIVKRIIE